MSKMEVRNPNDISEFEKHIITLESQKLQMLQGIDDQDLNFLNLYYRILKNYRICGK